MLGWAGVLNFSMVTIACLYIGMGFFGYLRYVVNLRRVKKLLLKIMFLNL